MRVKYRSACNAKGMKAILATILQPTFYKIVRRYASASRTNGIAFVTIPTNRFKILVTLVLAHTNYLYNGYCSSFK